jgi:uncharacterized protein (TIGR02444 family)
MTTTSRPDLMIVNGFRGHWFEARRPPRNYFFGGAAALRAIRIALARKRASSAILFGMAQEDTHSLAQGSPFWRFSLCFYRQPGVADACIALQEEAGVDVNLLLFLLWHAAERRTFSPAEIGWFESKVGPWRDSAVIPLRSVRRALKTPVLVAAPKAEALRTKIKAIELEAERLQQEAMYEFAAAAPAGLEASSPGEAARDSLAAYAAMLGTLFPVPASETVLATFATLNKGE